MAFILAGVIALTVLVPKTAVSVAAGALFGTLVGGALMLAIAVIAAAVNYHIGRWWLHDSIDRKLADAGGDSQHQRWFHAIRDVASEAGFRFHFLIRLTPIPTTLISYAMGASGSKTKPFLLAAAAAVLPQLLWVHGGTAASLIDEPAVPVLRWCTVAVSILAGIAISVLVPKMAFRRIESMKAHQ
ncbi:MAG: VTT domain-containing protein [Rubripirellula sp.]